MATTVVSIPLPDGKKQNLMFSTLPTQEADNVIAVTIYLCTDDYIPSKVLQTTIDQRTEEEYHTQLRKASFERKQFINGHSTNPEWNNSFING